MAGTTEDVEVRGVIMEDVGIEVEEDEGAVVVVVEEGVEVGEHEDIRVKQGIQQY